MASDKDTIYVDVDDEITAVIDKVKTSKSKVVALVLPKRASVFQSIVNMKLLKKATDSSNKHLVLITTEAGLMPLAGASGIYVAKSLTSKPEIPLSPAEEPELPEEIEGNPLDLDKSQSVGTLAAAAGAGAVAATAAENKDDPETLALDNTPKDKSDEKPTPSSKNAKKDKKLKVPNFERFRKYLLIGGAVLVVIIILFILFSSTFAKATINISTDGENISTSQNLNLSTTATAVDPSGTLPAKQSQEQKTYSQQVTTTGQTNHGTKASGSVTITNCGSSDTTLPGGTGFSSSGNTYISQQDVTIPVSDFKGFGGKCENNGKATVNVVAQSAGASYNIPSGATFAISNSPAGLSAQGGNISGGTDNIVQSVNQNDINNAKSKINANNDSAKNDLIKQINSSHLYPIKATFSTGTPKVTSSANVGDVANSVTVTENITYTMFGVNKNDLVSILDGNINGQIDTSKQSILNDGLDKAVYNVNSQTDSGAQLTLSTTAAVGPHLDIASIKKAEAGKKAGEIKSDLLKNPDVTNVKVNISPFWATTVPSNTTKITIKIAKPTTYKSNT